MNQRQGLNKVNKLMRMSVARRRGWSKGRRRGGSFGSFLKGANSFLKKSGLLSTLGNLGSQIVPGKWGQRIGTVGKIAGSLGYGRRRRCGGALRLAGGGSKKTNVGKQMRGFMRGMNTTYR